MAKSIEINILGKSWMGQDITMTHTIRDYQCKSFLGAQIEEMSREELVEAIAKWVENNSGDFSVVDAYEFCVVTTKYTFDFVKQFSEEEMDKFLDLNPEEQ